jgi:hypothetical protein
MKPDRDEEIQNLLDAGQTAPLGDGDAAAYQRLYADLKAPSPKGLTLGFANTVVQKIKKAQAARADRRINLALAGLCFLGVLGVLYCLFSLGTNGLQAIGQVLQQVWPGALLLVFALWMYHWVSMKLSAFGVKK